MGEDLDRERKIFITTTSNWIEIPSIIKEFSATDSLEENNNFIQTELEGELVFTDENIRNFGELIKLIGGDWEPFTSLKHYLKTQGRSPLTKKRTKKILMSRGYSRNEANALLEDIEHRTMSHLDKFFPKNN